MSAINPCLDSLVKDWYAEVYSFCFIMTGHEEAAREITFQTFLYAGADEHFPQEEHAVHLQMMTYAVRTCEDYYLRRIRPRPDRKQLEQLLNFPIRDPLYQFLCDSLVQKAAIVLRFHHGFTIQEIADILKLRPKKVSYLVEKGYFFDPTEYRAFAPKSDPDDTIAQFSDELYLRFEERSVGVENKLRSIRLAADKNIGWVALGILILFAAAALYTAYL